MRSKPEQNGLRCGSHHHRLAVRYYIFRWDRRWREEWQYCRSVHHGRGGLSLLCRFTLIASVFGSSLPQILTFYQIPNLIMQSFYLQPSSSESQEGISTMLKWEQFKLLSICCSIERRWFVLGEVLSLWWSIIFFSVRCRTSVFVVITQLWSKFTQRSMKYWISFLFPVTKS